MIEVDEVLLVHSVCDRLGLVEAEGTVGDADAVAFKGDYFFRMIGENANVLEAEVDQDLGADATFLRAPCAGGRARGRLARL